MLVWDNLRTILAAADLTVDHIVRVTSYLRDAAYAEANAAARVAALGGRAVPTTAIVVGTLEPSWLVEIEVIAARGYTSRSMRLLVTGGAGYIGSIVAQQLVARGDDVTVLDSLYRGHRAAVPEGAAFVAGRPARRRRGRRRGRRRFDGVLHFAALSLVGESVEFPERYWRGNVVGALNLLDAMRASGRASGSCSPRRPRPTASPTSS